MGDFFDKLSGGGEMSDYMRSHKAYAAPPAQKDLFGKETGGGMRKVVMPGSEESGSRREYSILATDNTAATSKGGRRYIPHPGESGDREMDTTSAGAGVGSNRKRIVRTPGGHRVDQNERSIVPVVEGDREYDIGSSRTEATQKVTKIRAVPMPGAERNEFDLMSARGMTYDSVAAKGGIRAGDAVPQPGLPGQEHKMLSGNGTPAGVKDEMKRVPDYEPRMAAGVHTTVSVSDVPMARTGVRLRPEYLETMQSNAADVVASDGTIMKSRNIVPMPGANGGNYELMDHSGVARTAEAGLRYIPVGDTSANVKKSVRPPSGKDSVDSLFSPQPRRPTPKNYVTKTSDPSDYALPSPQRTWDDREWAHPSRDPTNLQW